jgi:hypothetical protein
MNSKHRQQMAGVHITANTEAKLCVQAALTLDIVKQNMVLSPH